MRDRTLLKIALVWSLIGIFLLIIIALFTKPAIVQVSDLEQNLGKTVVVSGVIDRAVYKEKVAFIDLEDKSGMITVVIFDKVENKVFKNNLIQVKGKVQLYKGELEIIADEIICIKC